MKKVLLFAFALLFAMASMAQNRAILLQESFDGSSIPTGWSIVGQTSNWSVSATNNAGGSANEMKLDWSPQFNGMTRLVSPAVDLTGLTSVVFSFKHALDNYQGSNTIGVATSSDGGNTWNQAWTHPYNTSASWSESVEVTTPDVGQSSVQFCIFFNGSSYNINDWYFDDILVFTFENLDLGLEASTLPSFVGSGDVNMGIKVFNYGITPVTSVEASYQVAGSSAVTETFDVNIPSLGSATLNFNTPHTFSPGSFTVNFSINKVNGGADDVAENNTVSNTLSVALTATEMIPMIEHFSSSTCGPCVSVNNQMQNFCNNNVGRFTYTKYQMNWPGNGDPYYTNEGGVRRDYYGVSAVPQCFLDGEDQGYAAVLQPNFDNHAARSAFMDVRGSFTVDGNTIHVLVDVMPFIDVNARVYVSVNEKETHNNVGGNGETSFHHVFMKMLPNADGTTVDFAAAQLQQLEFTQDMSSTHVEEMSDLEVSIWVQNYASHEVLNSHFAYEYTDVHPYPVQNLTLAAEGNNLVASWNAPTGGNATGYNVYVNGQLAVEGTTDLQYQFAGDPNAFSLVEVVALYGESNTSVKAVASLGGDQPVVCNPVTNLTAEAYEYNGEHGALVSWTEQEGATGYQIWVGEEYLGEAPSQPIFIVFTGEPLGLYTIGVVAIYADCESEMTTVEFNWNYDSLDENPMATAIYPSPTSGNFTIEGVNVVSVEIYNLVGQKVYEAQGKTINVDAADWDKGIYLVKVSDQNGAVETRKLMVK
ncbi:MAG: T9SS type A sorting domain-containing protein [Bacteroidales bacterium]|nr:T9SS type A sorting domain-containing protein [Bacteroidales bacterium]